MLQHIASTPTVRSTSPSLGPARLAGVDGPVALTPPGSDGTDPGKRVGAAAADVRPPTAPGAPTAERPWRGRAWGAVRAEVARSVHAAADARILWPARATLAQAERWTSRWRREPVSADWLTRVAANARFALGVAVGLVPVGTAYVLRGAALSLAALWGLGVGLMHVARGRVSAPDVAPPAEGRCPGDRPEAKEALETKETPEATASPERGVPHSPPWPSPTVLEATLDDEGDVWPSLRHRRRGASEQTLAPVSPPDVDAVHRRLRWLDLAEPGPVADVTFAPSAPRFVLPNLEHAVGEMPGITDVLGADSTSDTDGVSQSDAFSDDESDDGLPRVHFVSDDSALRHLPHPGLDPLALQTCGAPTAEQSRFVVDDTAELTVALARCFGEVLAEAQALHPSTPTNSPSGEEGDPMHFGIGSDALPSAKLMRAVPSLAHYAGMLDRTSVPLRALLGNQAVRNRLSAIPIPARQQILASVVKLTHGHEAWLQAVLALSQVDVPSRLRDALNACPALHVAVDHHTCTLPPASYATPYFFVEQLVHAHVLVHVGMVYQGCYPMGRERTGEAPLQVEGPTFVGVRLAVPCPERGEAWADLPELVDVWLASSAAVRDAEPRPHETRTNKRARGGEAPNALWYA